MTEFVFERSGNSGLEKVTLTTPLSPHELDIVQQIRDLERDERITAVWTAHSGLLRDLITYYRAPRGYNLTRPREELLGNAAEARDIVIAALEQTLGYMEYFDQGLVEPLTKLRDKYTELLGE